MKIGVIGSGYVGLTTGICLASIGHHMTIYDIHKEKLKEIQAKKMPFYEKGLQKELETVVDSGNLGITYSVQDMVENSDGCFVCVGTPSKKDNSIDLTQIKDAITNLGIAIKNCDKDNYIVIVRSTVVPSTTRTVILPILNQILTSRSFGLCIVPEFLREGQAFSDFMNPDKIVIGYLDEKSKGFVSKIFEYFKDQARIIFTNPETAEMIKYTNNAFLSTLISFSNEIANLSEKIKGVDTFEVMKALVADKRITTKFDGNEIIPELVTYLLPGCGFGGSCFPKDIKAITEFASSHGSKTPLLEAVLRINEERPKKIISLTESILGELRNKKIGILGLAFKPETDDIRSSPSIEAIKILQDKGSAIVAYDPKVGEEDLKKLGIKNVNLCNSIEECLKDSNIGILLTKWPEFKKIDGKFLKRIMKNPLILDGRGFLDKEKFEKNTYYRIGYVE